MIRIVMALAVLAAVAAPAQAESYVYALPSLLVASIDDPAGKVDGTIGAPLLVRWQTQAGYDRAWYSEFGYLSKSSIDASGSKPGSAIEGYQLGGGYAWRFRFSKEIKPWVTAGLRVTEATYSRRYSVDSAGYLTATYPDRSQTAINAALGVYNVWPITDKFEFGVFLEYGAPISSDVTWFGAGVAVAYKLQ